MLVGILLKMKTPPWGEGAALPAGGSPTHGILASPHWMPRDPAAHAVTPLPAHTHPRVPLHLHAPPNLLSKILGNKSCLRKMLMKTHGKKPEQDWFPEEEEAEGRWRTLPRASSPVWRVCLFLPSTRMSRATLSQLWSSEYWPVR